MARERDLSKLASETFYERATSITPSGSVEETNGWNMVATILRQEILKAHREDTFDFVKESTATATPDIPVDLFNFMDKTFPNVQPKLGEKTDDIWFRAGQRSVIEWLKDHVAAQQRTKPLA